MSATLVGEVSMERRSMAARCNLRKIQKQKEKIKLKKIRKKRKEENRGRGNLCHKFVSATNAGKVSIERRSMAAR